MLEVKELLVGKRRISFQRIEARAQCRQRRLLGLKSSRETMEELELVSDRAAVGEGIGIGS